jgi:hypothetical protein
MNEFTSAMYPVQGTNAASARGRSAVPGWKRNRLIKFVYVPN